MNPISATATIDAPRERVFEFLCDLANRPSICDHFVGEFRLERLDSRGVGAAARFRSRRPRLWVETVIEEVVPPHGIHERGRAGRLGRIPVFTVWELVDGGTPRGCEVTVTFWTEPSHPSDRARELLGGARRWRRNWKRAVVRLRDAMESDRPVERVAVAGADRLPGALTVA
jgi:uncharacterized protein YndB with AHSA1/START domain